VIVFLTGGTGFIGRNLAVKLARRGHHVRCLVRDPAGASWMREHPGLDPVRGDIGDPDSLRRCLEGAEAVFHLAGVTKAASRDEYLRVNGRGTEHVASAVAAADERIRKVLLVSSLAVAGPRTAANPAREEDEPGPITWYGESKLLGERLLLERCGHLPWTIVRPPVVYGPFDRDVFLYFKAAASGFVPLLRGGTMELSLVHVEDLTDAILLAGFSPEAHGKRYYVSDGAVHTTRGLADLLRMILGRGAILPVPASLLRAAGLLCDAGARLTGKPALLNGQKVRESLQDGWVCSDERIRKELGYAPRVGIEHGFRSTLAWYRENGWI